MGLHPIPCATWWGCDPPYFRNFRALPSQKLRKALALETACFACYLNVKLLGIKGSADAADIGSSLPQAIERSQPR